MGARNYDPLGEYHDEAQDAEEAAVREAEELAEAIGAYHNGRGNRGGYQHLGGQSAAFVLGCWPESLPF